MKRTVGLIGVLTLVLAPGVGCSPAVRTPHLYNPGPASYQQYNAQNYDPYPLPDAGPPVDGARPLAFQTPRPQVERARQYTNQQGRTQFVAPAPQMYAPAQ
ncbi:membrane or secreted protein [Aeoliella sp. ICT_H6.2]|uniref:Membrane or secreted protein n=1 Tax=Aeoliella straminimaris TaxID=2954799 RepID=A0A9X2FE95_9BACT|nr:membrane or secreted protein [Aeoliella straminimaris]MCO6047537.1 membrane or secreted protein [Aeoliella straminimaris]